MASYSRASNKPWGEPRRVGAGREASGQEMWLGAAGVAGRTVQTREGASGRGALAAAVIDGCNAFNGRPGGVRLGSKARAAAGRRAAQGEFAGSRGRGRVAGRQARGRLPRGVARQRCKCAPGGAGAAAAAANPRSRTQQGAFAACCLLAARSAVCAPPPAAALGGLYRGGGEGGAQGQVPGGDSVVSRGGARPGRAHVGFGARSNKWCVWHEARPARRRLLPARGHRARRP